ncbi:T9SS type A sorting domain-containing protein [Marinilabilia sp.]|uniref:T9SS type A sorting domain-containing protein n=1 Tax=Marinilabilia sp. TaxID=2021252 RepID=UPI0025BE1F22|nr:T9SS type A sorting domain-containing protein [Marinilabilia sp.]
MKKLSTIISFLIVWITVVNGAEITVTNNQNSGNGSFRNAVAQAADGDNIIFDGDFTIFLETPILLGDKTLSIDGLANGNKVILDGNYLDADNDTIDDDGLYTRIFTVIGVADKDVNLSNLIIQHGSTDREAYSSESFPSYQGGGVYIDMIEGGNVTFTNCTIQNNILSRRVDGYDGVNQVTIYGAGVFSNNGGDFVDCTIKNNIGIAKNSYQVNINGGGACFSEGGSLRNCLIAGNKILFEPINNQNFFTGTGAGLDLSDGGVMINCVIVGNFIENVSDELEGYWTTAIGGGLVAINSKVYNTTIVSNGMKNIIDKLDEGEQGDRIDIACGGAIMTYQAPEGETNADITDYQNNVLYGNYLSSGYFHDGVAAPPYTQYLAVSQAAEYDSMELSEPNLLLQENPFIDLPFEGEDGEWGTDDDFYGDLRLRENSPLIDAGNPNETQFEALSLDFYGRGRINNNRIDIGALEFYASDVTYSLSGKVHAGALDLSVGTVEAYDVNDTSQPVASAVVNSDGTFEFPSLVPGDYYFYAIPDDDTEFYATWFGDETEIVNAISIDVDDIIYDVDIHLISKTPTSVADASQVEIEIYPNPASEIVNIKTTSPIKEIVIYDSFRAQTKYFDGSNTRLVVSDLRAGVYVISVVTELQSIHQQLIIK